LIILGFLNKQTALFDEGGGRNPWDVPADRETAKSSWLRPPHNMPELSACLPVFGQKPADRWRIIRPSPSCLHGKSVSMLSEPLSSITGRLLLRLVILFAASAAAGLFLKKENHLNGS